MKPPDAAGSNETNETPAPEPESEVTNRRRFIKIGIGVAAPVIVTVTSRPGWAQGVCQGADNASRMASIEAGGSCRPVN
jgi:hypothetical protein